MSNEDNNNNIKDNEQELDNTPQEPVRHGEKGGYTPMTDKQIKRVRLILYIVLGIVAAVIIIVRAVKGA